MISLSFSFFFLWTHHSIYEWYPVTHHVCHHSNELPCLATSKSLPAAVLCLSTCTDLKIGTGETLSNSDMNFYKFNSDTGKFIPM